MAKVDFTKIRIVGMKAVYESLLQSLQSQQNIHIIAEETESPVAETPHKTQDLELSRLEFVLRFLEPWAPKKGGLVNLLSGGKIILTDSQKISRAEKFKTEAKDIMEACEKAEVKQVKLRNEKVKIPQQKLFLEPFLDFKTTLQQNFETETTKTFMGTFSLKQEKSFLEKVGGSSHLIDLEIFSRTTDEAYFRITLLKEAAEKMLSSLKSFGVNLLDPSVVFNDYSGMTAIEASQNLLHQEETINAQEAKINSQVQKYAESFDEFKILFDVLASEEVQNKIQKDIFISEKTFGIEAWIQTPALPDFRDFIQEEFGKKVILETIKPKASEIAPTKLKNKIGVSSFEAVTNMYGVPSKIDIDPTPLVMPFFIIAFGLCLSDVGYGSLLTLFGLFFYRFGRFTKEVKEGILLIILCGISAIIGGIILGGYFGMTLDQAPSFLLNSSGEAFRGQMLNLTKGNGPIILLGSVFGLGLIQILVGFIADGVRRICIKDYVGALADSLAWFFFLITLVLIGVGEKIGIPTGLAGNLAILGAIILILTQGRSQKGIVGKFFVGVLSLYNVVNYFSDLLSYARVMALGLATGVVASVMNTIGIQFFHMISETSFILALVVGVTVILFGHILNFLLSLLGAFIHTGRLQFVEFFGKFYEGGGYLFSPFKPVKKYTQTVGD